MALLTPGPLTSPLGTPTITACFKQQPDDFCVTEVLGFAPDGEGEHLWLDVEKVGLNTERVARALAEACGVAPDAVSWSGLKDRHARTRQWFSVQLPQQPVLAHPETPTVCDDGTWCVHQAVFSRRKLRRGAHAGNTFRITLRAMKRPSEDEPTALSASLEALLRQIQQQGVPNYFGAQRFGHAGANLGRGLALLADRRAGRRRRRDPRENLWVSAVRSALFNHVLAARVQDGSWNQYRPGDVLQLDGRGSFFQPTAAEEADWPARLSAGLLHPTGPLPGAGVPVVHEDVAALEQQVLAPWQSVIDDLAALKIPSARRALRVSVADLSWSWLAEDTLTLTFYLTAGAFATSVLQSIVHLDETSRHAFSAEQ